LNIFGIFENIEILIFMKICPVGAELFHADEQTDIQTDGHGRIIYSLFETLRLSIITNKLHPILN